MLVQITSNCLMTSSTLESGRDVQLARSTMSSWKSS
uniref:Me2 n=1 Tax=Arundo donax TaxID=35708 RepID=A0A0A9HQ35_ARUDO